MGEAYIMLLPNPVPPQHSSYINFMSLIILLETLSCTRVFISYSTNFQHLTTLSLQVKVVTSFSSPYLSNSPFLE